MAWRNRLTGLLILFTLGCTPMMYGVSLETWESLNEAQRLETIDGYNQRQVALQQARAKAARSRAAALELQRQRESEEDRLRQVRVDAVYRGEGHYGDLLRITIAGGDLNFSGKQRPYDSLSFKIAEGEIKSLQVTGDKRRRATLVVSYLDGTLIIDDPSAKGRRHGGIRLGYDPSWGQGKTYTGLVSDGPLRLRGAEIAIQIASQHPPVAENKQPQIIIIQNPSPPQTIIVRDHLRKPSDQRIIEVNNPPSKDPRRKSPMGPVNAADPSAEVGKDHHRPGREFHSGEEKREGKETRIVEKGVGQENQRSPGQTDPRLDPQGPRHGTGQSEFLGGKPLKVTLHPRGKGKGLREILRPIVFAIRAGENLQIPLESEQGATKLLLVGYQEGVLYVDGDPSRRWKQSKATALTYDETWTKGRRYKISTEGPARMRDCEIFIQETSD
ncbi:hypothetical protein DSOUD_1886 [Desulfuromonas soudanensis]|uniref:Uncharacterized protein n=1 Tax=Desulfuromonas soudanensis TaxID=1603606 RepID=A0A0M4D1H8_9BACT|nr:hypothetical protein [Desulfuromonas soudanensis]ALC16658.1 hypothetical protein DSOUD_1886 [Desulfuromonas soudanensis]